MSIYFIAELGQNHQGNIDIACKMVDELVGSGVSAIKTAKRDIDICLTDDQKKQPYTGPNSFGATYYEHRKALELSCYDFENLKNYSESKGFDFISSFTDINSFNFLSEIGIKKIKIASSRIIDIKLLKHVSDHFYGQIYMSSGMSTNEEIQNMINIFHKHEKFLLHCTSVYPCPENKLNLNVIPRLIQFDVDGYGFSGHHASIAPDIAAYLLGADIIERHFTLNRSWKGSDHAASLGIDGIKKIIKYINQIDEALGDGIKKIYPEEIEVIKKLRSDLL